MKAVKKMSTVQAAANSLIEYIKEDEVRIGDKMPAEMTLCSELGVGRGTVREAMRLLQASGYVELKPGRGAFVASKTEAPVQSMSNWFQSNSMELESITQVRSALEPLSVRLAIENCTPEKLQVLKDIQKKSEEAAAAGDVQLLGDLDEQFHRNISEFSGNALLIQFSALIAEQLKNFRSHTFNIPKNVKNFIPAHSAILEAFEANDPDLGERRMKSHMKKVERDLLDSYRHAEI